LNTCVPPVYSVLNKIISQLISYSVLRQLRQHDDTQTM